MSVQNLNNSRDEKVTLFTFYVVTILDSFAIVIFYVDVQFSTV